MSARLTTWRPRFFDYAGVVKALYDDRQRACLEQLLDYLWINDGRLPLETQVLVRAVGKPASTWAGVMGEFIMTPEGWEHPVYTPELRRAQATSKERRQAASKRWDKPDAIASPNAHAKAMPRDVMSCSDRSVVSEPSEEGSAKEDSERGSPKRHTAKVVPLRSEG